MKTGLLAFWLLAAGRLSCADGPPILSVCEALRDRLALNGKAIIVVGHLVSSKEGSSLGGDCGRKSSATDEEWGNEIWLGYVVDQVAPSPPLPQELRWSRKIIIPKLPGSVDARILRDEPECRYGTAWAAVYGRLETRAKFPVIRYPTGESTIMGFGHLGGWPAQLIWPEQGQFCLVSDKDKFGPAGVDPARSLWMDIRSALVSEGGADYFAANMKGALVPGGAVGVSRLKGTLISSTPKELVLGLTDPMTPEATLRLDIPLAKPLRPGTGVEFEGVAKDFVKDPFMVTFEVASHGLVVQAEPAEYRATPVPAGLTTPTVVR